MEVSCSEWNGKTCAQQILSFELGWDHGLFQAPLHQRDPRTFMQRKHGNAKKQQHKNCHQRNETQWLLFFCKNVAKTGFSLNIKTFHLRCKRDQVKVAMPFLGVKILSDCLTSNVAVADDGALAILRFCVGELVQGPGYRQWMGSDYIWGICWPGCATGRQYHRNW